MLGFSAPKGADSKYRLLPADKLRPDPNQPRRTFDESEIESLAASVRECGLLQPITVRRDGASYIIIAGERRFRACVRAGIREIPCIVSDADPNRAAVMSLTENMQRSDLDVFEEAAGIARAMQNSGCTQEQMAAKLGKSQSAVANKLRLLKLPDDVIESIRSNGLTERHARALLRLPDDDARRTAIDEIVKNGWNVARAEEYIEAVVSGAGKAPQKPRGKRIFIIKDVRLLVNSIAKAVGTVRACGIDADMRRVDEDDKITLTIVVPRTQSPVSSAHSVRPHGFMLP